MALENSAEKSQQIEDLQREKSQLEEFLTTRLLHQYFYQYYYSKITLHVCALQYRMAVCLWREAKVARPTRSFDT